MYKAFIYLFTFICIQFGVQFGVVAAYTLITGQPSEELSAWWNIAIMAGYSLVTIIVFIAARWFSPSRSYVRSHPWAVMLWSAIAALGAIVPSMALQELLPEWTGWARELAESTEQQLNSIMQVGPAGYMVIALLPPVVEEMVFRGAILRALLQWKPQRKWIMIALSAAIFALVHVNPAQMPHAFLIGLLLGWMFMRTGSIVPGVVYHWTNNSAAYAMFHLGHNPQSLSDLFGPEQLRVVMAVLFSLCILLPALFQLNMRMKNVSDKPR
ncbi:MAG: CPBP family intramembrane metalloprotease [Prevotella sp.]|nr:CPBP family intramembrane metalloprotease [Prevotella sp.]